MSLEQIELEQIAELLRENNAMPTNHPTLHAPHTKLNRSGAYIDARSCIL